MYTQHLTILPYSHEENSIVERENRKVLRHLRAIVFDRKIKSKWSKALCLIQRFLNTTDVSSTGFAPNQIIFGNNVKLENSVLYNPYEKNPTALQSNIFGNHKKESNSITYTKYISDLLDCQAEILARAQQIQSIVANQHIKRKQAQNNSSDTELQLNSYVLWERPDGILNKDSRPDKLSSHYRGPYRVISYNGSRIDIQNVSTKQIKIVHISELVPFKFDPNLVNSQTVALHADQEFEVEKILDIRGTRNTKTKRYNRKDLFVKVLWKGYPEDEATWEPYKELKGNNKFYNFCYENHHMDLIDKRLFSDT